MRRWIGWLVGLALLLGACGPLAEGNDLSSDPMVLDYNFGTNPTSLDPALAIDAASQALLLQLFEGLTAFEPTTGETVPALAEAWDVSEDGLTYTFKLRAGVLWVNQEGDPQRELVAEDVVYAIRRACDPATLAPTAPILFVIDGCQAMRDSATLPDPERVGVRALAPLVVEFALIEPAAYFPTLMAIPVAWPVPGELVEQRGATWTEPATLWSNGPFLLAEWQRGEYLTLVKNEHYHDAERLMLHRVNGHMVEVERALAMYQQAALDTVAVPATHAPPPGELAALGGTLTRVPLACTYGLGFTQIKPPVDHARVRRALSLAIDREWLAATVLPGNPLPATHFAPPFVFGALPPTLLGVPFDVPQAQRLLAEAGYPEGEGFPRLTLMTVEHEAQSAQAVAEMWRTNLGIEVTVQTESVARHQSLIDRITPLEEVPHAWMLGWCADFPDAHDWLYHAFNLAAAPDDGVVLRDEGRVTVQPGGNHLRRAASRFDELTAQAATHPDPLRRREMYAEAEELLVVEEAMIVPLYHPTTTILTQPWLQRSFSPLGPRFKEWTVDMAAKAAPPPPAGDR